uniref:Kinesin-like protein KIF2A-like N-terminal domain-containing protein n=1 Tax=Rhodnius prolixus TaxID=13249 RepID=T1I4Y9_RHOPR
MGDIKNFLIRSGISVQIRRTDGRTHPAIVSNVNSAMQTVTVEWFERGETKGKEIDFATIYALNANLHPTSNINNQSLDTTSNIERERSGGTKEELNYWHYDTFANLLREHY